MRLAVDHHYSPRIAEQLRDAGYDVVAAMEARRAQLSDEDLLEACRRERRALLTNNVADLAVIARQWDAEGRQHHGLIFTADSRLPRSRHTMGQYIAALDALLRARPRDDALAGQIHWL